MNALEPAGAPAPTATRRLRAVAAALLVAAGGAVGALYRQATPDDFYITYRYSARLAHGAGFTYNDGERVFGTSDPGWGLLLGALAAAGLPPPATAAVLFGACAGGVAALLALRQARAAGRCAALAGVAVTFAPGLLWLVPGAAAAAELLLLLAAAHLAADRPALAGGLGALAVCVRPDAGLAVALLTLVLWRERRAAAWRFALVAGVGIALALGAATLYFGRPLPSTLGAKVAMVSDDGSDTTRFLGRATLPLTRGWPGTWPAAVALGLAGQWLLWRRGGRPERLLVLFAATLLAFYVAVGAPFFAWYVWIPEVSLVWGLAALAAAAWRAAAARWPHRRRLVAATVGGLVAALFAQPTLAALRQLPRQPSPRLAAYRQAGEWIRAHTAPADEVAYVEIGVLGYTSERPLRDLLGLVTPDAVPYVRRDDLAGAFLAHPTRYLLARPGGRMDPIVLAPWFGPRYAEVFAVAEGGPARSRLAVYALRPDAPAFPERQRPRRRAERP